MESKFILIANNKHVKAEKKYQFPRGLVCQTGRVSQDCQADRSKRSFKVGSPRTITRN